MSFGFIAIDTSSALGGGIGGISDTRVWGESVTLVVLGFAMIATAFLVSSSKSTRVEMGGVIGSVVSLLGVLVAIEVMEATYSALQTAYGGGFEFVWMQVGYPIVLFAGFPLGLVGSLWALQNRQGREEPEKTTTETTA
jgi:hypothetical protein